MAGGEVPDPRGHDFQRMLESEAADLDPGQAQVILVMEALVGNLTGVKCGDKRVVLRRHGGSMVGAHERFIRRGPTMTLPQRGRRFMPVLGWRHQGAPSLADSFAAPKIGVTVALADRYRWHRDELYYLASSRHLALGYVDYPPIRPLLARIDQAIFPGSVPGLRLLTVLAGAAVIIVAALIARELGGKFSGAGARRAGRADLTDVRRRQYPLSDG